MHSCRWGIIAPGKIARRFATALNGVASAVCYAVASRSSARAQAFATEFGFAKSYGDYQQLIEDPMVDAIYIASPHNMHYVHSLACLKGGKATLCEKPMSVNARQASGIIEAATAANTFYMEAVWTRFLPIYQSIREWLDQGLIGEVKMVHANFGIQVDFDPKHRLYDPHQAGGATLDVGIYPITLSQWVYQQQPQEIKALGHIGRSAVDEQVVIVMKYPQGQISQLGAAISAATTHAAWIYGSEGKIHIHPQFWSSEAATLSTGNENKTVTIAHRVNGYEYEINEVHRCLAQGLTESPMMPWATSLSIMQTMDEIRSQLGLQYPFEN